MKIEKHKGKNWFNHKCIQTKVVHGLSNVKNQYIGYNYQDNAKGFWLHIKKI